MVTYRYNDTMIEHDLIADAVNCGWVGGKKVEDTFPIKLRLKIRYTPHSRFTADFPVLITRDLAQTSLCHLQRGTLVFPVGLKSVFIPI